MKRKYYNTCETCGANLDPGEKCTDCENDKRNSQSESLSQNDDSTTVKSDN